MFVTECMRANSICMYTRAYVCVFEREIFWGYEIQLRTSNIIILHNNENNNRVVAILFVIIKVFIVE